MLESVFGRFYVKKPKMKFESTRHAVGNFGPKLEPSNCDRYFPTRTKTFQLLPSVFSRTFKHITKLSKFSNFQTTLLNYMKATIIWGPLYCDF